MAAMAAAGGVPLGRCRGVDAYQKLNRVGEGTYGIVCKEGRGEQEGD